MSKLIVYTDGGARGNPGEAAIGAMIKTENGQVLGTVSQRIGKSTNNIAEYTGVLKALENLKINTQNYKIDKDTTMDFYCDSALVVNQLNGIFKVKDPKLRSILVEIRILESEIGGKITYTAIPREKNWEADSLVNRALDEDKY